MTAAEIAFLFMKFLVGDWYMESAKHTAGRCPASRRKLDSTRLDGDVRVVTFDNGMVMYELIVSLDDQRRRFVQVAVGGRASHHNASIRVLPEGSEHCRSNWITEL